MTRKLNIKQFCKDMYNLFGTPIGSHRSPNNLETCWITARNGHLDCLWIAWENGWSWDERVSKAAADSGTYPAWSIGIEKNILGMRPRVLQLWLGANCMFEICARWTVRLGRRHLLECCVLLQMSMLGICSWERMSMGLEHMFSMPWGVAWLNIWCNAPLVYLRRWGYAVGFLNPNS